MEILKKLPSLRERFQELEQKLSDPRVTQNPAELRELHHQHRHLQKIMVAYEEYQGLQKRLEETHDLLREQDSELQELAREEIRESEERLSHLEQQIKLLLVPPDPDDERNVIVEIRAGAGGEEAALFAAELFRMYCRYAEEQRWRRELINSHPTELGGFKEVVFGLDGDEVFRRMKFESGTHRVQRIPVTEAGGRIHTSTATVAVLPEPEDVEIDINPKDLKVEVFRASGPGGQHVNVTDSAVRITHFPTGITVQCQDEKSQHKNKAKAMKVLRARIYEQERRRQQQELAQKRRQQIGSGERSEKIRTYNYPQNRVTDHRLPLTLRQLREILEGHLELMHEPLVIHEQTQRLQNL